MKKYLLLFLMCVYASIGAWADTPTYLENHVYGSSLQSGYIYQNASLTIVSAAAGDIASDATTLASKMGDVYNYKKYIYIVGPINADDITAINNASLSGNEYIDYSYATGVAASAITVSSNFEGLGLPAGSTVPEEYSGLHYIWSATWNAAETAANGNTSRVININFLTEGSATEFNGRTNEWTNNGNPYYTANTTMTATGIMSDAEKGYYTGTLNGANGGFTYVSNLPYEVSGRDVTLNMSKRGTKTFSELITEALAEVRTKTGDNTATINTLTIEGTLTSEDVTALNSAMGSGGNLASITSLNLGGATGMAQTDVDALAIPTSLTNLAIPSGKVVTAESTLATRAANNNDLWYIYSPTSDAGATVPDYVWVVKDGGLEKAFQTETGVRNSIYVKVASSVVLTNDDMDLSDDNIGNGGIQNLQFYDLSDANLVPAVSASYNCPDINKQDGHGYRIILPNNRTGDQMAIYSANSNVGKIAAVYSYTGTKLNILEIVDDSYSPLALTDPRIMRSTTTEVDVVSGTQNGQTYSSFGGNLLAAINNMGNATTYPNSAGLNVRTVSISTGSNLPGSMTFSNPAITTLELKNVSYSWAVDLNVNACTSLQTLNLNYATLGNVTAQVSSLTNVDLSAAILTSVDLTGAALTTAFTMDDDTNISGDLTLKSTGLTSFTPQGTIGGDIYLNASNSLASLDVRQFTQAASKKIHIDADATDESKTAVISGLDNGTNKTITVPTGYKSSERFHPYDAITDNIDEAPYIPEMVTKSTTTMMLHEKDNTADGDNYIYWYDDQEPTHQGNNVTIGTSAESGHSLAEILTNKSSELDFTNTTYRRAKIDGPIASTDVDDLANIKCQVLDLSSATFDEDAWAALKTAFAKSGTGVHSSVKFVILPDTCTREEIINGTALEGLTNVLSVIALNKITGATDASDNGTNLTSWNRVSGALQAAVVAAGNRSCQSWTKTPDGKTSRNIYTSDISDFRECKISGLINSHDLSKANQNLDANGHLSWDTEPVELSSGTDPRKLNGSCTAYGPFSASFNLSVIDLQGAFFEAKGDNQGLADKDKRYYFQDMTLSTLGIISTGTYKVVVPTDPRAKEIPADFMNCSTNIRAICIPSNIVAIRTRAFYTIDYVWTTATNLADTEDPEGDNTKLDNGAKLKIKDGTTYSADGSDFIETSALIYENGAYKENPAFTKKCYVADYGTINGGGTYTFGSNLRLIETGAFANTQPHVKDVYVLNTKAPECHVDAFNTVMYTGNGGYSPISGDQKIISRENYFNNGFWITMLHYPRQTTTPDVQRYTDPTREYSIATGERDGKGAPIYFPNQSEFIRAYIQGTYGYVWNAWNPTREYGSVNNGTLTNTTAGWEATGQTAANALFDAYTSGVNHEYTSFYKVSGLTEETVTAPTETLVPYYQVNWNETSYSTVTTGGNLYPQSEIDKENDADKSGEKTTKDYRGWHQFVLNAYAANTVLKEEPYRSYITDNEWWTICPTFDITREEAIKLFGTPASWNPGGVEKIPYVSKLRYVRRTYRDQKITLNFSDNLMVYKETRTNATDQHGTLDDNGVMNVGSGKDTGTPNPGDVVMSAGVPYLIKPNMTAVNGGFNRQFRVYTDADYAKLSDEQKSATNPRAINSTSLYNKIKAAQEMPGDQQIAIINSGKYTVPVFVSGRSDGTAAGYEVEAVEMKENGEPKSYTIASSPYEKSTTWKYTFVGTFYKSFLPHYCYYLGWDSSLNSGNGGARFFYLDGEKGNPGVFTYYDNNMNWNNETGVICPTNGDFSYTVTPASGLLPATWIIGAESPMRTSGTAANNNFLPIDSYVMTGGSGAKAYEMVFGAPDVIADNSEVTGISNIDANNSSDANNNTDVYTINGQKVGTSLEGLPKGIYIVNGKKFIVK